MIIIGKSLTALGGGGLKPEIRVTAKAGALLNLHYKDSSIILQSYQLEGEETKHTFVVSVSETAYVIEDASNGESVEVLVDAVAQYSVEIHYVLWLYKDGDECEDITGGFSTGRLDSGGTTSGKSSKNDDHIYLYGTWRTGIRGSYGYVYTNNKIDLSAYTKLVIEATTSISVNPTTIYAINFSDSVDGNTYTKTSYNEFTSGHMEFDLSSFDDAKFITIGFCGIKSSTNVTTSANITKIWLE